MLEQLRKTIRENNVNSFGAAEDIAGLPALIRRNQVACRNA
jgi:hypothetical protein